MREVPEMRVVEMTWQLNPEIALFLDLAVTDLPNSLHATSPERVG
jgi:hypothetical protein